MFLVCVHQCWKRGQLNATLFFMFGGNKGKYCFLEIYTARN